MDLEPRLANSADTLDAAIESYRATGRPPVRQRRWVAGAAASALIVVGIGGVVMLSGQDAGTPSQGGTSTLNEAPGPTVADGVEASPVPAADSELLGYAYALMLPVVTREEAVAFLSVNVPEDEVAACMSAAGFEYQGATPEQRVADDVRYTMSPAEYAATYGLGITGWVLGVFPGPSASPSQDGDSLSGSEVYKQTLAQCRGLFDPARRAWSDAINIAVEQFRGVAGSDERTVAGLTAWQSCMAAAGYEFDSPMSMRESFYSRMNTADEGPRQIFDDEVRVAVANVPCEAAYIDVQREVMSSRFTEFKTMFDAALASGASPDATG